MGSTDSGQRAEELAAEYLRDKGHKIVARNWRNRWCEIDVVSSKGRGRKKRVHFVEVKYRQDRLHGSGFDYITPRKADQLKKAALNWITENEWDGDYSIDVASVDGIDDSITYIEDAIQA